MVRILSVVQPSSEARQNNSTRSGPVSSAAMVSVAGVSAIGDQAPSFGLALASNGDGTGNACCFAGQSNDRQGLAPFHGVAPTSRHLWVGADSVCPGVSMSRQAAQSDAHMKRIASDADHWHNRLERFAELRRASEADEANAVTKAMGLPFRESSPLVKPSHSA